ncbi:MAG: InlB B-repeat-containing protein, partial [Paracholeplasma sp.]
MRIEWIKKSVLTTLFFLTFLGALPFISNVSVDLFATEAIDVCDGDYTSYSVLPTNGGLIASGSYYLDGNTTLLNNILITSGEVTIDLSGYILKGASDSDESIFTVTGGTLNIKDCNNENRVHSYEIKEFKPDTIQDIYASDPNHSNKLFQRYYDFDGIGDGVILGGVITGGHKFQNKVDLSNNFYHYGGGSAFLISGTGILNFYGGTISGNTVTALSQWGGKRQRSGAVGIYDGGTFNFYEGQIIGNSSRFSGAAVYLFGSSSEPARANIYGGIIKDNYALDVAYTHASLSSMYTGGGAISTDNVGNEASIVTIKGAPQIIENYHYNFDNTYIKTNMSYSTESVNSIKVDGLLYKEVNGIKTYARIGLWGGAGEQLTTGYTSSGNTHEDVNKIFFADNVLQAVSYNQSNEEIKYVTANLNTLTYEANDGSLRSEAISVVDKISVSYPSFTRDGYEFDSWNTTVTGSGTTYKPNDILTLSDDQTLYAIWTKKNYTVDLMTNGGTLSSNTLDSYTFGNTVMLPTPTWAEKTFDGWYEDPMLTGSPVTQISSTDFGNKVFYAKWLGVTPYVITSTSGVNGSITPIGRIIYDGTSQTYLIEPDPGYKIETFVVGGIDEKAFVENNTYEIANVTSDVLIQVTFEKILSSDLIIYATSEINGVVSPKGFSVISNGSDKTYTITPNPGYQIKDVLVNNTSVGKVSSYTFLGVTANQTIHATFELITTFPITFYFNGGTYTGSVLLPDTYEINQTINLPQTEVMSKAHYHFDGWYSNEELEGSALPNSYTHSSGVLSLYAKWVADDYTITYHLDGGINASENPTSFNIETQTISLESPTKEGYHFEGWYENSDFSGQAISEIVLGTTSDITLYAKFSINTYEVTFKDHDGTVLKQETVDHGSNATSPTNPTRVGYTFTGWDIAFDNVTSNLEVIALYEINKYTVIFKDHDGTV